MDLSRLIDIEPEPMTSVQSLVYDSMSLKQRVIFQPGEKGLGRDHPDNLLRSPFVNAFKKTSWYLRDIIKYTSDIVWTDYSKCVLFMIQLGPPSERDDEFDGVKIELNGRKLQHTFDYNNKGEVNCFFSEESFPLFMLGPKDDLKFISSRDIYLHIAYVDNVYIDYFHEMTTIYRFFSYEMVNIDTPDDFSLKYPGVIFNWDTIDVNEPIEVYFEDQKLWQLPHFILSDSEDSKECTWNLCIDKHMSKINKLHAPGLPENKKIRFNNVENLKVHTCKLIELRGYGTSDTKITLKIS